MKLYVKLTVLELKSSLKTTIFPTSINASYYNFYTSTLFENNKNVNVIITDINENPKTIRLVYSNDLKFIDKNNAKYEIYGILNPLKKVV